MSLVGHPTRYEFTDLETWSHAQLFEPDQMESVPLADISSDECVTVHVAIRKSCYSLGSKLIQKRA